LAIPLRNLCVFRTFFASLAADSANYEF